MKKLDNTVKKACRGASKGIRFANVFLATAFLFLSGLHLSAQTAIGANTPDPSAMLDVQSNERGVLFPRMTTAERILINPAPGLMIFNTTENCLQINVGTTGNPDWRNFLISSTVGGLTCGSAMVTGSLTGGQLASGVSISLPYTGGTGGGYLGEAISSTGVTGLTATLQPGTFATGSGTLTFNITGTPASAGTASFVVNIGGQSCTLNVTVIVPNISTLNCAAAIRKGEMQPNFQADGVSVIVPYTGGDGSPHAGQTVNSTGVAGYTATLASGNFATGDGTLTYIITGTSNTAGTANFALNIGGRTCNLDLSVRSCSAKVSATDTIIFLCYNLGAYNTRADPFTPSHEIIGDYYHWGRNPACFGTDGVDAPNPCSSPVYGAAGPWGSTDGQDNAGAITGWVGADYAEKTNWTDTPTAKGPQDPCPQGFRVPSQLQWQGVIDNNGTPQNVVNTGGSWTNNSTNYDTGKKYGDNLFLPAAGRRSFLNNGTLEFRGSNGYYWSSGVLLTPGDAVSLDFGINNASFFGNRGTYGFSLRCVAEGSPN